MSAESGLKTFRDNNGLWENHDVMEVASPEGFARNPELVLSFYNQRRKQLFEANPNAAHKLLASLEENYAIQIITQNVDDLHERAGSTKILHLHGELRKIRSTGIASHIIDWQDDLFLGDVCPYGHQLRPHIVWFGESVPKMEEAIEMCQDVDMCIIIGSSLQVYPAASLVSYIQRDIPILYVDPRPATNFHITNSERLSIVAKTAVQAIEDIEYFVNQI